MLFEPALCPTCESPAKSSLGSVLVDECLNYFEETKTYEYADQSDPDWNCQATDLDGLGRLQLSCPDGHTWRAVHLDPDEDEVKARDLLMRSRGFTVIGFYTLEDETQQNYCEHFQAESWKQAALMAFKSADYELSIAGIIPGEHSAVDDDRELPAIEDEARVL